MLFIIHHPPITAKGGCLWQQNNGNAKVRIPWWNISLMATPVCAESNVNTAARSSTPRPGTENIVASRLAVTRCWICGKALKSALSEESIPALAAGSSSYQFGRMPDIAAMPVVRKTTASVKWMLLLSCKVVLPILGIWEWAIIWNQVTLSVTWFVALAESSSHFGNLILAVTKPPELSFWELRFYL